jgi:hypothetical protein
MGVGLDAKGNLVREKATRTAEVNNDRVCRANGAGCNHWPVFEC